MQLREIGVNGFGALAGVRVRGLGPGLNVLFGPNEFGKTSLLELCRRVLYGFPTRRERVNPYPALASDKYGGELHCQLGDGTRLTVARTAGRSGGRLTVVTDGGRAMSEDELHAALGHVSADFYRNVYAIDLQALGSVNVVGRSEWSDRIIGAGLGLGRRGLPELREPFEQRAEALFTSGGRAQRMPRLASRIVELQRKIRVDRETLATYDATRHERDQLELEVAAAAEQLRAMRERQRELEARVRLYPTYLDVRHAERRLIEMGDVPEVTEEAMTELATLVQATRTVHDKTARRRQDLQAKDSDLRRIACDEPLLAHEGEIVALSQSLHAYRSALDDLPRREGDLAAASELLRLRLATLGEGWTAEAVRDFALTIADHDVLREAGDRLLEREEERRDRSRRLEMHRDEARSGAGPVGARALRWMGLVVFVLGAAGCALSTVRGDAAAAALSGATSALGLALLATGLGRAAWLADDRGSVYEADLRSAERQEAAALSEWRALLEQARLPAILTPAGMNDWLREIDEARGDLQHLDALDRQRLDLERTIASVDEAYARVTSAIGAEAPGLDPASRIERLASDTLAAAKEKARRDDLARDALELREEIACLERQAAEAVTALTDFLARHEATDAEDLRDRHERARAVRELRRGVADGLRTIEAMVGEGRAAAVLESLDGADPGALRADLEAVGARLEALDEARDGAARRAAELDHELRRLASDESIAAREAERERVLAQLGDDYRDWLRARIALWGIAAAVARYEEERQPDVIRAAEGVFAALTDGRFTRLIRSADGGRLIVRDGAGRERTPDELSRGTREQLYLALRLGLIEQYERNAEPLPVILDDILVNFDDARGPLAVQALARFARDRQVIVMTCHAATRRLYVESGGMEVHLEAEG